jgi:hypothetical protein
LFPKIHQQETEQSKQGRSQTTVMHGIRMPKIPAILLLARIKYHQNQLNWEHAGTSIRVMKIHITL